MEAFLSQPRYSFIPAAIKNAPEHEGVFGIFRGPELIFLGHTDTLYGTIKAALTGHFEGLCGDCTMDATRYAWEVVASPRARLLNLLQQFQARHQRAPRCNEKLSA